MKFNYLFYIAIINISSFFSLTENNDTIRFAFILSRTGSHSPSKLKQINSENYKDIFGYNWLGENELTKVGKRQQFYLGCWSNYKYKNILISETYHPKDLLSRSSECNKTIQSSYAYLHGLYQNSAITLTNNQIDNAIPPLNSNKGYIDAKNKLDENKFVLPDNIQIVPVHTFYEKAHNYLLEKVDNCPSIKKFYEEGELMAKKKKEEILYYKADNNDKTYGELLTEIINEEKIFDEIYNINSLLNNSTLFRIIAETFICDYFNGVNLDKFIQKNIDIYKLLQMFEEYFGEISIGGGLNNDLNGERKNKTYELSQKVNYDLFNGLLEWTKIRIDNDIENNFDIKLYESPKLVIYLSHHESVESLYYFLKETFNIKNLKNPLYVNFTSFIAIELYRKNNNKDIYDYNDFYIKLFYDNKQIGDDILYNEFYDKVKDKIITFDELEEYCGISQKDINLKTQSSTLKYEIIGILLICIFPVLASISALIYFGRKKNNFDELPEDNNNNNNEK